MAMTTGRECQGCGEPYRPEDIGDTRCTDCGAPYPVCGACPPQMCDACLDASLPLFGAHMRLLMERTRAS